MENIGCNMVYIITLLNKKRRGSEKSTVIYGAGLHFVFVCDRVHPLGIAIRSSSSIDSPENTLTLSSPQPLYSYYLHIGFISRGTFISRAQSRYVSWLIRYDANAIWRGRGSITTVNTPTPMVYRSCDALVMKDAWIYQPLLYKIYHRCDVHYMWSTQPKYSTRTSCCWDFDQNHDWILHHTGLGATCNRTYIPGNELTSESRLWTWWRFIIGMVLDFCCMTGWQQRFV